MKRIIFAPNYIETALWMYESLREKLSDTDFEIVLDKCENEDEIIRKGIDAEILYAWRIPITARIINSLPKLKLVMSSGGGFDHIDVEAASKRNVQVTTCPNHNVEAVAEMAIAFVMALSRRICWTSSALKKAKFADIRITREITAGNALVQGKKLGLIGFGRIARSVARKAAALGMSVYSCDPFINSQDMEALGVNKIGIDELMSSCDYISVHVRLSSETINLIGNRELALMKPSAHIINTSRGGIIKEQALYDVLKSNRIRGAATDVLVNEPARPDEPLLSLENCIVTGHDGGTVNEAAVFLVEEWHSIILAYIEGKKIPGLVNA